MNYKFLIAVVAAIAPLSHCQVMVGQMNPIAGYTDGISSSSSQAQAQAQSQANAIGANVQHLQSYLNYLQPGQALGAFPGVNILAGAGYPGAASPIPAYNPYAAQDAVSDSLAETNLANQIRHGQVQVVPPNLSSQAVLQSVHVPVQGRYSNTVYASQPLPPMYVSQPGAPEIQISSGPAAVVSAAPVIYRQPPSVVYQNEVINQHPVPLSLNPVYVKVYKPGKKVIAPSPVGGVSACGPVAY